MHDNKKYERIFITLTPESGGYVCEGKKLMGSAILEIRNGKGILTANIQGLKPLTEQSYKIYLISSRDKGVIGVPLGIAAPDRKGKCSKAWDFDPDNVCGSGIGYSEFNVVAIIVKSANASASKDVIAPLVGYRDGMVIWKSGFREAGAPTVKSSHGQKSITPKPLPAEKGAKQTIIAESTQHLPKDKSVEKPEHPPQAIGGLPVEGQSPYRAEEQLPQPEKHVQGAPEENQHTQQNITSTLLGKLKGTMAPQAYSVLEKGVSCLEKTLPDSAYEPLIRTASTTLDYIPGEIYPTVTELVGDIARFVPDESYNPFKELTSILNEYLPQKVIESNFQAARAAVSHLDNSSAHELDDIRLLLNNLCRLDSSAEKVEQQIELAHSEVDSNENGKSMKLFNITCENASTAAADEVKSEQKPASFPPGEGFMRFYNIVNEMSSRSENDDNKGKPQKTEGAGDKYAEVQSFFEDDGDSKSIANLIQVKKARHNEDEAPKQTALKRLKSGMTEAFTLQEPSPGEDHDAKFREKLKDFSDRFSDASDSGNTEEDSPAGSKERVIHSGEGEHPSNEKVAFQNEDRQSNNIIAKKEDELHFVESFDDKELQKIFDSRPMASPFGEGHRKQPEGGRGNPHGGGIPHGGFPGGGGIPHDGFYDGGGPPSSFPGVFPGHRPPGYPEHRPPHSGMPGGATLFPYGNVRWVKLSQGDLQLLPPRLWRFAATPFAAQCYKRYHHFILGVEISGKRRTYYFGAPGIYSISEKHRAESAGFTRFLPANAGLPRDHEFGYWIGE